MRRKKQRILARRRFVVIVITLCVIVGSGIVFGSVFAKAQDSKKAVNTEYKYYKSIVIEAGDTLWDIAKAYKSDSCSTEDYIKEVKELNSLATSEIHEDQHLMIVYYETEFK